MAKRVLFVDDEKMTHGLLEKALGLEGYELLTSSNGAEGFRLAKEKAPDVIIVDHIMPVMSGLELCQKLRRRRATKNTPIILMTACDRDSLDVAFTKLHLSAILYKPHFTMADLLSVLKAVMNLAKLQARAASE